VRQNTGTERDKRDKMPGRNKTNEETHRARSEKPCKILDQDGTTGQIGRIRKDTRGTRSECQDEGR